MAKRSGEQPQIRKSYLIILGVVLAVAVVGFVLMNFAINGGDSPAPVAPQASGAQPGGASAPTGLLDAPAPAQLRAGGRDPFKPVVVAQSANPNPAPAAAPAPSAAPEPQTTSILLEVVSVDEGAADVRVNNQLFENVKAGAVLSDGFVLEAVQGDCAFLAKAPERFRVCEGERFLR